MILPVKTAKTTYDIVIETGCLNKADEYLSLDRKVLIVTDEGVPSSYSQTLATFCKEAVVCTVPQGEPSKSLSVFERLLTTMLEHGFTRSDCVAAVGGGVVGDLGGFTAACYMRGIDFYNIPTTVLSQVDSSIGGKTAVNLKGYKNMVGAFYPPRKVLIDPLLLSTLPKRQIANGLAESVKMALTSDAKLFECFEREDVTAFLPAIIEASLRIKKDVVEQDETEQGIRKILNFGHTIGHGIESFEHLSGLYHGECVALGMIPMCSEPVRIRLLPVLKKLHLPTSCPIDAEQVFEAMLHDKKKTGDMIYVTTVDTVGQYTLSSVSIFELREKINLIAKGEKSL